jgi:tRNA/rRNA methyltransferase
MPSATVRLVLLRPRNPENLGAIARAMKNFGLADWAIVDPRTQDFSAARRVAVHAEEILDRPRVVSSLDEAIGDCAWVVGTSSRRVHGKKPLSPEAVAREALRIAPQGATAIVFGDERSGLSNEEIDRCHDLSTIPTLPEQPSLNLAQALLLYAYELHRAELAAGPQPERPQPCLATDAELSQVEEALRELLRKGGFLVGNGERHAVKDLFAALRRARLVRSEARLWLAALKSVARR